MQTHNSYATRLKSVIWCVVLISIVTMAGYSWADDDDNIILKRIGLPCFKPVDIHLFSSSLEAFPAPFFGVDGIFQSPSHELHPQLFVGPGEPHDPPYDKEFTVRTCPSGHSRQKEVHSGRVQLAKDDYFSFHGGSSGQAQLLCGNFSRL